MGLDRGYLNIYEAKFLVGVDWVILPAYLENIRTN